MNEKTEQKTDDDKGPDFATMDDVVNYVSGELGEIKKLAKMNKKDLNTKADFQLYHEQNEGRLSELNDRLDNLEEMFNGVVEKIRGAGSSTAWKSIIDWFFKP